MTMMVLLVQPEEQQIWVHHPRSSSSCRPTTKACTIVVSFSSSEQAFVRLMILQVPLLLSYDVQDQSRASCFSEILLPYDAGGTRYFSLPCLHVTRTAFSGNRHPRWAIV